MQVGWVYHQDFLKHDSGADHPECSGRLLAIVEALQEKGILASMKPLPFAAATPEMLCRVHEPAYISLVRRVCAKGIHYIGSMDTGICQESYDVAMLAVGGVLAACDAVMSGEVLRAFCAIRPPGHHAERDQASGFCLFNNVAIAADTLICKHGLDRVAIVDFDVHHGNGTQHIFEDRDDVLYISLHAHPDYHYPGTGYETEEGTGQGQGYTLNIPMPLFAGDSAYQEAFAQRVLPKLNAYRPQMLLLSAGFDAVAADQMAQVNVEPELFGWITRELVHVAQAHCSGRVVSILEGGYHLPTLKRSIVQHLSALME